MLSGHPPCQVLSQILGIWQKNKTKMIFLYGQTLISRKYIMWQVVINTMKEKIKSGKRHRECRGGVGSGNGDDF